jgi:cyclophilin family peptidyl-prolyl cis-trans isomerase
MQRRRKVSHDVRNAVIILLVLIFIVGIVAAAYLMGGHGTSNLTYSDVSATSSSAGASCAFSALWVSNTNVSGYVFGSNNTGTFVNGTWTAFYDFAGPSSAYSRATETLEKNIGDSVTWGFWVNDTNNQWSAIPLQILSIANPLSYSLVNANSSNAGSSCLFSAEWSATTSLSGFVFGSNNTGTFVNETWVQFSYLTGTSTLFSTAVENLDNNIGDAVTWGFWVNDTNNIWGHIPLQTLYIVTDKVLIQTTMGNITVQLFDDMPITTGNFQNLVRTHVYDETTFNRVHPGFIIQGGDATVKGINVPAIADELPNKHSNLNGTLAMAKTSQPNSATCQFFINVADNSASLDSTYSVFGQVISGMDVVEAISNVPFTANSMPQPDGTPVTPITIASMTFIH